LLNDDQRRRLAVKGKMLGRKVLEQVATIVLYGIDNTGLCREQREACHYHSGAKLLHSSTFVPDFPNFHQ
jgi:hypothetical protein